MLTKLPDDVLARVLALIEDRDVFALLCALGGGESDRIFKLVPQIFLRRALLRRARCASPRDAVDRALALPRSDRKAITAVLLAALWSGSHPLSTSASDSRSAIVQVANVPLETMDDTPLLCASCVQGPPFGDDSTSSFCPLCVFGRPTQRSGDDFGRDALAAHMASPRCRWTMVLAASGMLDAALLALRQITKGAWAGAAELLLGDMVRSVVLKGDVDALRRLLAFPDAAPRVDWTELLRLADSKAMVLFLVDSGRGNADDARVLVRAAQEDDVDLVTELMSRIEMSDAHTAKALEKAVTYGSLRVLDFLLPKFPGAFSGSFGVYGSVLDFAQGNIDLLRVLAPHCSERLVHAAHATAVNNADQEAIQVLEAHLAPLAVGIDIGATQLRACIVTGTESFSVCTDPLDAYREHKATLDEADVEEAGRTFRGEHVLARSLRVLVRKIELETGIAVKEAVIAVPALFTTLFRQSVLDAANGAGIHVIRIVPDSAAAALGCHELPPNAPIAVALAGHASVELGLMETGESGSSVAVTTTFGKLDVGNDEAALLSSLSHFFDFARVSHGNAGSHLVLHGGRFSVPDFVAQVTAALPDVPVTLADERAIARGAMRVMQDAAALSLVRCPVGFGIDTGGGVVTTIIPTDALLPAHAEQTFSTPADGQTELVLHVFQGSRVMAKDNALVARATVTGFDPAPRGIPQITFHFDVSEDGLLTLSATDARRDEQPLPLALSDGTCTAADRASIAADATAYAHRTGLLGAAQPRTPMGERAIVETDDGIDQSLFS